MYHVHDVSRFVLHCNACIKLYHTCIITVQLVRYPHWGETPQIQTGVKPLTIIVVSSTVSIAISTPGVLVVSLELPTRSEGSKRSGEPLHSHLVATPTEWLEWAIL